MKNKTKQTPSGGGTIVKQGSLYLQDINSKNEEITNLEKRNQELESQIDDKNFRLQEMEKKLSSSSQLSPHLQSITRQATVQINNAIQEDEMKKFAFAAHKTIETLQELINEKNDAIKRKEDLIERMKIEYLQHKESDTLEIQRLNEIINQMNQNSLLNSNIERNKSRFYESSALPQLNLADIDKILQQKDKKIEMLSNELIANEKQRKNLQVQINEVSLS